MICHQILFNSKKVEKNWIKSWTIKVFYWSSKKKKQDPILSVISSLHHPYYHFSSIISQNILWMFKRKLIKYKSLPCTTCSSFLYIFVESQKWKHQDRLLLLLILRHHQSNFHILSEGHLQPETICEINQRQKSLTTENDGRQ